MGIRAWFAMTLGAMAMAMAGAVSACDQPADTAALRAGLADWINQVRQEHGLGSLHDSGALQSSATGHACDMAKRQYFAHEGPGGPSFGSRIKRTGYRFKQASENIATTRGTAVGTVAEIWRNSPPHWANILKPGIRDLGIGIAQGSGRTYWVMNVGRSKG